MNPIPGMRSDESIDDASDFLYAVLISFRRSFLMFTGGVGVLFVLTAMLLLEGTQAGIVGLFGYTFIGVAIAGRLIYWILRNVR